jgi:hypothetical protein
MFSFYDRLNYLSMCYWSQLRLLSSNEVYPTLIVLSMSIVILTLRDY